MTAETGGTNRLGRSEKVLIALAIVGALLGAAWLLWPSRGAPPPAPSQVAATPVQEPPPPQESAAPPASPQDAHSMLEAVSGNPIYRRWLAVGDLVRRWAIVTDNAAEGVTPRKQLAFLDPGSPFSVERRGDKRVIAAESYARYDGFADAVASVDAQAVADVYRRLHPVLEGTYRELGYPDASLDRVTARALRRILAAPVREGDVVVVEEEGLWLFGDPALERLPQVEKHFLRMGPRNTRLLQAKAREIQEALDLPAEAAKAR